MGRLTKKYNKYGKPYCFNCDGIVRFDNDIVKQTIYKLGQLEDIEDKIGCPLDIRCKVVCDTTIYGASGNKYIVDCIYEDRIICHNEEEDDVIFLWWEYGDVWCLKEDIGE